MDDTPVPVESPPNKPAVSVEAEKGKVPHPFLTIPLTVVLTGVATCLVNMMVMKAQVTAQFETWKKQQALINQDALQVAEKQKQGALDEQQHAFEQKLREIMFEKAADFTNWTKQQDLLQAAQINDVTQSQAIWMRQQEHIFDQRIKEIKADHSVAQQFWDQQQETIRAQQAYDHKVQLRLELVQSVSDFIAKASKTFFHKTMIQEHYSQKHLVFVWNYGFERDFLNYHGKEFVESSWQRLDAHFRLTQTILSLKIHYDEPVKKLCDEALSSLSQMAVSPETDLPESELNKIVKGGKRKSDAAQMQAAHRPLLTFTNANFLPVLKELNRAIEEELANNRKGSKEKKENRESLKPDGAGNQSR